MPTVIVRGGIGSFEQEVVIGRHRLVADEPEGQGGHDAGPSPYDYLLAALGT
jgi:putative redox protein